MRQSMRTARGRLIGAIAAAMVMGAGLTWAAVSVLAAGGQVATPRPETLRFQLIGNEPIAGPDGRGVVAGWAALMFRDRTAQRCYIVLREGTSLSGAQAVECPPQ